MKNCLIYYGWLNSFNSGTNGWNNEKVAKEMAQYDLIVMGDGIQSSSHGDYSNTQVIIPRIKVLNPSAKIFGYVSVNQSYTNFKSKSDDWNTLGVNGIFFDEAGYDFGSTSTNGRDALNDKLDYVHSLSSANCAFLNAWKVEHLKGTNSDASYPDSTWNPDGVDSNILSTDHYLLESHAYSKEIPGYESASQWKSRAEAAVAHDWKVVATGTIQDGVTGEQDLFDFMYCSAKMWDLEAVGSSDQLYGASSAKAKMYTRPADAFELDGPGPVEAVDGGSSVYRVYYPGRGYIELDFTSSSESSTIKLY